MRSHLSHISFLIHNGFTSIAAITVGYEKVARKEKCISLVGARCIEFEVAEEEGFEPSLPLKR